MLTIDKGLDNYRILKMNKFGKFLIPDGWRVLSLEDLSQPAVQAAMLSLFTSALEVEQFNRGELKVIREAHIDQEVPEYDILMRKNKDEDFIIPNGWQRLPDSSLKEAGVQKLLEAAFRQNDAYREAFSQGLLTIIKKGWVRVPINNDNSSKFQPIFVEHWTD